MSGDTKPEDDPTANARVTVAIGASAASTRALGHFLADLALDDGMAAVVVLQHREALDEEGLGQALAEAGRELTVVRDDAAIEPGRIYLPRANDIVTVGIGMAASMGQLLLTAGTKGKRYITPNARVLLHQPHGGFGGTASDIQTQAQLILDMKRRLAEITAAQTGKTVEQINADGDRDRWFNAQEALEYGFVDHIRESALDVSGGGGTDQAA